MFKNIISAAIVASIAFTSVGNAAINEIGTENRKNIITSCLAGYEHSCVGVQGNIFFMVDKPNKSLIEVPFKAANFNSSEESKSYIKAEITKIFVTEAYASKLATAESKISELKSQISLLSGLTSAEATILNDKVISLQEDLAAEEKAHLATLLTLASVDDGITQADIDAAIASTKQSTLTASYNAVHSAAGTYANQARIVSSAYLDHSVTLADITGAVERLTVVLDTYKASISSARDVTVSVMALVNEAVTGLISAPVYEVVEGTLVQTSGYTISQEALATYVTSQLPARQLIAHGTFDAANGNPDPTYGFEIRNNGAVNISSVATYSNTLRTASSDFSVTLSTGEVYTGIVSIGQKYNKETYVFTAGEYVANIEAIRVAIESAWQDGYDTGYSEGYADGYADGFTDGVNSVQ